MSCRSCGSKSLVIDDVSGVQVCSTCGVVQDLNNLEHHFGGISGPQGTFVRLGTAGAGTNYSYRERKLYQSDSIIRDITYRLDLIEARVSEVKDMIEKITDGEFGVGDWFSVLVGACSYLAMRKAVKPLQISDVADVAGCDLYEMGKMISRVVQFLGLELPEFDIVGMLEKMIRNYTGFEGVDEDKMEMMIEQGNFIIQCTMKWYLTTGRKPGPVAVAVLVFIGKLNGISVKIEDVAKEANHVIHTCKKRYNELLEALVKVARILPWGEDVNVKNIVQNAPFVIKYMEMKSREKVEKKRKGFNDVNTGSTSNSNSSVDVNEIIGECLGGTSDYRKDWRAGVVASESNGESLENAKISPDVLRRIYSKMSADASKMTLERNEASNLTKEQSGYDEFDLSMYNEWWTGRSELCKKLMADELNETDVGFDPLPPSYVRGCIKEQRRRKRIEAAKTRISLITSQPGKPSPVCSSSVNSGEHGVSEDRNGRRRKRKRKGDLDWEDFIIETLLLHKVKEEEIEKGHYNTLLDLHVFNSAVF